MLCYVCSLRHNRGETYSKETGHHIPVQIARDGKSWTRNLIARLPAFIKTCKHSDKMQYIYKDHDSLICAVCITQHCNCGHLIAVNPEALQDQNHGKSGF